MDDATLLDAIGTIAVLLDANRPRLREGDYDRGCSALYTIQETGKRLTAERDEARAEAERLREALIEAQAQRDEARADLARLRPVVEAACAWRDKQTTKMLEAVLDAVDTYRAQPATRDPVRAFEATWGTGANVWRTDAARDYIASLRQPEDRREVEQDEPEQCASECDGARCYLNMGHDGLHQDRPAHLPPFQVWCDAEQPAPATDAGEDEMWRDVRCQIEWNTHDGVVSPRAFEAALRAYDRHAQTRGRR